MTPANDNRKEVGTLQHDAVFVIAASCVVLLALIVGVAVSPSPWTARDRKLDQALVQRLSAVQNAISSYHRINGKLPPALGELLASPQNFPTGNTKESLGEIEYTPAADGGPGYGLCANFLQSSANEAISYVPTWTHQAGRQCFQLKAADK